MQQFNCVQVRILKVTTLKKNGFTLFGGEKRVQGHLLGFTLTEDVF